ncbi:MAG: hypothetical protein JRG68_00020 [Deltaproteobacteria bacterium]|nr:hypothetical protein [Deltaproteobacteria bacterium]MBW2011626.1 hypothetical protein [Deltaproteobacteria bacterium]MBW2099148.1 hypothetical protein [Deltaproteobacteria bacterium]
MQKRPITPAYVIFYILFSPDTWRILIGIILAGFLVSPLTRSQEIGPAGQVMVWVMLLAIGWSISAFPGKKIADFLKRIILKGSK